MSSSEPKKGGRPRMDAPSPIDIHVGSRVKQRRLMMGLSQDKLAKEVGLTFQQIQKYEKGVNRIGASRLHDFGKVLSVPVSFFFDEIATEKSTGFAEGKPEAYEADPMSRRDTLELVRAFSKITNPKLRKQIADMVKTMAASEAVND